MKKSVSELQSTFTDELFLSGESVGDEQQTQIANRGASNSAIQFHYDVGNDFYARWLDDSMIYSAARWSEPLKGRQLAATLQMAQIEKLKFHLDAVGTKAGSAILDVGCGWGAVLRYAVDQMGVKRATGLTLSEEQASYIRRFGYKNIDVHLRSYEHFEIETPYDGIISIGAFEHFIKPEMSKSERLNVYGNFFRWASGGLTKRGRLSLQTICWSNVHEDIAKKIVPVNVFPESDLPYLVEIFEASSKYFSPIYMENGTTDYITTLQKWLDSLQQNESQIKTVNGTDCYDFYRNYLRNSIVGFKKNRTSLARIVFDKN